MRASYVQDSVDPDSDPSNAQPTDNGDGTETYNGYTFNVTSLRSFPLGLVVGLQSDNSTYGKCFIMTYDSMVFVDYFEADWEALFSDYNYYNLLVYDPVRLYGNLVAIYE